MGCRVGIFYASASLSGAFGGKSSNRPPDTLIFQLCSVRSFSDSHHQDGRSWRPCRVAVSALPTYPVHC